MRAEARHQAPEAYPKLAKIGIIEVASSLFCHSSNAGESTELFASIRSTGSLSSAGVAPPKQWRALRTPWPLRPQNRLPALRPELARERRRTEMTELCQPS
jgi:hypothetical protein